VEKKICNALQCKCLERSRKTIFRVAVWRFVIWQRAALIMERREYKASNTGSEGEESD
jgi:hypothetical protein